MSSIIHIAAESEPKELHGQDGAIEVFGAHLAFEATEANEMQANAKFAEFLTNLPLGKFYLFAIDNGNVVHNQGELNRAYAVDASDGSILTWLEVCHDAFQELADNTIELTPANTPKFKIAFFNSASRTDADMRNARATDLLRATGKWPAHIAQDAGLTVPLISDHARLAGAHHVVMFLRQGLDPNTLTFAASVDTNSELAELTVSDAGVELFQVRTSLVKEYTPVGDLFDNTGKFLTPNQTDALARLSGRIEELAPSLLGASAVMDDIALNEDLIRALGSMPPGEKIPDDTALPEAELFGLMRAGIVTLFDVPMIALQLPSPAANKAAPAQQRSTVLQRLSRGIASRFELENPALDVDETLVYAICHQALASKLVDLHQLNATGGQETLWTSLQPVILDNDRLKLLHDALVGMVPANTVTWKEWREEVAEYTAQLSELAVLLESESGAEAWLLGICDKAFLDETGFALDLTGTGIPEDEIDPALSGTELAAAKAALTDKLTRLYRGFRADIEGSFNASEAMRRDFGALVLAELSANIVFDDPATLASAIRTGDWFHRRIFGASAPQQALDTLIAPCIPQAQITRTDIAQLLTVAFAQRSMEILAETEALQRFRPDTSPQPLPIRIADTINPAKLDDTNSRISGLGFLIRSEKADGSGREDLHANAIALYGRGDSDPALTDPTVLPTLPVMTPGCAGLFVQYGGAPLASPNRPAPGRGGADMDPVQFLQTQTKAKIRGYRVEESVNAPPLRALAYGRKYAVSGFWVPGSGVLPKGVRAAPSDIFNPGPPSDDFKAPNGALHPYLRRTAIGDMELNTATDIPKDVHPLANDDPRLVLESFAGGARKIELNRRADGTGGLLIGDLLDDENVTKVTLNEVSFSGTLTPDDLSVRVLNAMEGEIGTAALALEGDRLAIMLDVRMADKAFWLELVWKETAPTNGCLSFDDPAHERQQDSAGRQSPVALLAPNAPDWTRPAAQEITLDAPRVSFADFECWARNSTLWGEIAGHGVAAEKLLKALLWAQTMFEETGDIYAEKMNKLPDPAVHALVLFAAASDQIDGDRSGAGHAQKPFTITPYNAASLPVPARLDIIEVPGAAGMTTEELSIVEEKAFETKMDEFRTLIDAIHSRARKTLNLQSSNAAAPEFRVDNGGDILAVPEGWVVRLAAQPAVPSAYLGVFAEGVVFDEGMQQLAQGTFGDMTLFDGTKLQIEAMRALPKDVDVPAATLQSTTRGLERAYALEFHPRTQDRIFASAQLIVQQWRPTGRPIYRWIDPVPKGSFAPRPVIDITPVEAIVAENDAGKVPLAALDGFEADAFFGIGRDDADRKPVIRLQPAPTTTRLATQDWPERSAAYFRHRLTLRSRYLGAMKDKLPKTTNVAESGAANWATRTVILADPLAADLSRPQLRAFFPVQRMAQKLKKGSTPIPPVACVLSEPPFEQLGLADRLDADLKTINTYRIDDAVVPNGDPPRRILQVDGMRKEIGPDPRLSYFPVADEAARAATLVAEGPVGLHFEADGVDAPAFSNSQFMLHVTADDTGKAMPAELEESFAGVSLTRYADPTWSYIRDAQSRPSPVETLPLFSATWIDLDAALVIKAGNDPVVKIAKISDRYTVGVKASALFAKGGESFKELCSVSAETAKASLLIRPLGDGRYQLSVHKKTAPPDETEVMEMGRIDRPQLVASVIITVTGLVGFAPAVDFRATRQSESTFVEWVRTARDMSHVMQRGDTDQRLALKDLTPVLPVSGKGKLKFLTAQATDCHIASPVSLRRYPLHVHRHLALLLRKSSAQIGHQIDLFDQAVLADGWGQADLDVAPGATVSVAELEMRAEIIRVTGGVPGINGLERYDAGHFDLASSRASAPPGETAPAIRQMRLHFRAANQPLDLRRIKFDLTIPVQDGNATVELPLDPAITTSQPVWSFDLFLYQRPDDNNGSPRPPSWSIRWPGSAEKTQGNSPDLNAFFVAEAFDMKITDQVNLSDERWLDVSLLHSNKMRGSAQTPGPDSFDFDWLFGAVSAGEALPQALAPERLNRLPEAQARLIGQSVPLDIKFK